jgi:uncharacterized protein
VRFWDASAVVPLCCRQPSADAVEPIAHLDTSLVVWWGTPVECVSALARLQREGGLTHGDLSMAVAVLAALRASWMEILPTDAVRDRAERLLRTHPLRAADALQLAAALVWAGDRPTGLSIVTLDDRLRDAALRESFTVEP